MRSQAGLAAKIDHLANNDRSIGLTRLPTVLRRVSRRVERNPQSNCRRAGFQSGSRICPRYW